MIEETLAAKSLPAGDQVTGTEVAVQREPVAFGELLQQLDTQVNRYLEGAMARPPTALRPVEQALPEASPEHTASVPAAIEPIHEKDVVSQVPSATHPPTSWAGARWTTLRRFTATHHRSLLKWTLLSVALGLAAVYINGGVTQSPPPLVGPLKRPAPEWGLLSGAETQPRAQKAAPPPPEDRSLQPNR
jgi:hypothetical protein